VVAEDVAVAPVLSSGSGWWTMPCEWIISQRLLVLISQLHFPAAGAVAGRASVEKHVRLEFDNNFSALATSLLHA
jgi:hypothetical protein